MAKVPAGLIAKPGTKGDQIVQYVAGLGAKDLPTRQEIATACESDHGYVSKYLRLIETTDGVPVTVQRKAAVLLERRKSDRAAPTKGRKMQGQGALTPREAYDRASELIESGGTPDADMIKRANAYAKRASKPALAVADAAA